MLIQRPVYHCILVLAAMFLVLVVTPLQVAHADGVRFARPAASGAGDCSNWANACTLQTALTGAASGDEIWTAAGTHKPTTGTDRDATFQLKDGVALYGGFAGTETARDQRSPATRVTILSGDIDNDDSQTPVITDTATVSGTATNSYHVVTGADGATLDGFTITAGNANGDNWTSYGGGMLNDYRSPTVINVIFSGNAAVNLGGGMYNTTSSPVLTNVSFSGNSAHDGGGMINEAANPTLTNVTFTLNTALEGGGMRNTYHSSPTLTNVTFDGNSATGDGAWEGNGGGISDDDGNATLTSVSFISNTARPLSGNGGGMYSASGNPTLTNVTFSGNVAWTGGGMHVGSGAPTLTNVTFSGNRATNAGGGMLNSASSPTLTNVTFSGNVSWGGGGGMFNQWSDAQIRNTIFWGNTTPLGATTPQIANFNSTPVLSDTVVQGGCPKYSDCASIITADPLLGTLGDHGGATQTVPLQAGSSAIDAGNDAVCPATDQRGVIRPQGAHCDIGAYERELYKVYLPLTVKSN